MNIQFEQNYRIIGDIHGRTEWKNVVSDDSVIIFVGDYFDPYEKVDFEVCKKNFLEIISYKRQHPKTILLLGNHDFHYFYKGGERYTRYNAMNAFEIERLFVKNIDCFNGAAYSIEDRLLVTHAGVSRVWMDKWLPGVEVTPNKVEEAINKLFWSGYNPNQLASWKGLKPFSFGANRAIGDHSGNTEKASPIWIRTEALIESNLFKNTNYLQVVGHTSYGLIHECEKIISVDALAGDQKEVLEITADGCLETISAK